VLNYIRGEFYRLLRKKSMYMYFGLVAVLYFLLAFMRSNTFTEETIVLDAQMFSRFFPVLLGGFLFTAIYTDDLNSKNLISLVGFGLSKMKIVVSKLILTALFSLIIFGFILLLHLAIFRLLGWSVTADALTTISASFVKYLLATIAYSVLSGIVVYGLQRTTFAVVLYIVFAFDIAGSLIGGAVASYAPYLSDYLMTNITTNIMVGIESGSDLAMPIVLYIIFVAVAAVLSALAFTKKEMEF